jgi:ubiquinone biosynthesis protein UbiJ
MIFQSFIVKNTSTLLNEMIYNTPDHRNKMMPLVKPLLYLKILTMTLNFKTTPTNELMTLITTVSRVKSITTLQGRAKNMIDFDVAAFNK